MSRQPEIIYERTATLKKILAIPDGRFKSGYRSKEVVAMNSVLFHPEIEDMQIAQNHIHKQDKRMTQTQAFSQITFTLDKTEREL